MERSTMLTRHDEVGVEPYDSIKWLFEVHVKLPDPNNFNCAIIHGNEDCPSKIELYNFENPRYDQSPDMVLIRNEDGEYLPAI